MADQKIQLTVQVNAETGQLEVLGAKFAQVSDSAKKTQGSFSGLSGEAGNLLKAFLPFATAGGIIAFFTSAVRGAEEENEAFRRLKFTIESTGQSWEKSRGQVELWTAAVANSTRFSDGEAIASLEKFTRVTGSLTQAQSASQLAMNLSVASGKQLSETISLVTDLLNGNERALIGVKREFADVAGGATTTQEALDLLARGYKDAATSSKGLTDSTAHLKNSFNDFKDTVGNSVAPALSFIFDKTTALINKFEQFSLILANFAAKATVNIQPGWRAAMKAIDEETERQFNELEKKKTTTLNSGESERLSITSSARAKQQAEDDKSMDEWSAKKTEHAQKIISKEQEMNQKMASLGQETLQKKLNQLDAEVAAEAAKNRKIAGSKMELEKLNDRLNDYHRKKAKELSDDDIKIKFQSSLQIADLALQTFATLNSMGNKHNEAEANRAKAILALEKAIAIARVWSAEASKGAAGIGIAAATTGLIVAQFAQQFRAIDQSRQAFNDADRNISFTSPIPGDGIPTDIRVGTGGGGGGGTVFNPSGPSAASSGSHNIVFQPGSIVINGVNDASKIPDAVVDQIGERLIERIKGQGQLSFTGGT